MTTQNKHWTTRKVLAKLWPQFWHYKWQIFLVVAAIGLSSYIEGKMISFTGPIIDKLLAAGGKALVHMALQLVFLYLLRALLAAVYNYMAYWIAGRIVLELRNDLFEHFLRLPFSYFSREPSSKLISKMTYNTEQIADALSLSSIRILAGTSKLISYSYFLFIKSGVLSIALLPIGFFLLFQLRWLSRQMRLLNLKKQQAISQVSMAAKGILDGYRDIKLFNSEAVEIEQFNKVADDARRQELKVIKTWCIGEPSQQLILSLTGAFLFYSVACFRVFFAQFTPGDFATIFKLLNSLKGPLRTLSIGMGTFQKGMAGCAPLFQLLEEEAESQLGTTRFKKFKKEIEFRRVSFSYPNQTSLALSQVSFEITAGQTVALVGGSGSGKSTLVSLLTACYQPTEGEILIDHLPLNEYSLNSIREQIAFVPQTVHLFNDTLAHNIAYGRLKKCTQADIEKAAKLAHVTDFLNQLPEGFQTPIGENGVQLSGGQAQRVAIARALLKKASLLILDEATSALDLESERAIQLALMEVKKYCTIVLIAHRPTMVRAADKILVLDQGRIVESGTHSSLMAMSGRYSALYGDFTNAQRKKNFKLLS